MTCSHTNDQEKDFDLICREWWGEEGCDFEGVIVAKECGGSWYISCPNCGNEGDYDL